jgi:hypothetical protein
MREVVTLVVGFDLYSERVSLIELCFIWSYKLWKYMRMRLSRRLTDSHDGIYCQI